MSELKQVSSNVDGLLQAFFRAEMPEPWPQWKPAGKEAAPTAPFIRPRGGLIRSRLALAASLLLVLFGYWSISGLHSQSLRFFKGSDGGSNTANKEKSTKVKPPASQSSQMNKEQPRLTSGRH